MLFGMQDRLALRGRFTLITGASSGLGREMARVIAREHGGNLVLVARRQERLEELARELRAAYGVEVVCLQADLTRPEDLPRIVEQATAGRTLHAAILNAGVAYLGSALRQPFADFERMLATNVTSTVYLSQRLLQHMLAQQTRGALMIVSSLAGITPTTWLAGYSGTKGFLHNFGMAVGEEVAPHGLSVTVFAPGGVLTEMGAKSGTARKFKRGDAVMMEAEPCARQGVAAMTQRSRFSVPGRLNQLSAFFLRLLPRTLATAFSARVYREALLPEDLSAQPG
jgi:short-subunit dehydrogenase